MSACLAIRSRRSIEALDRAIVSLSARINAATCELLTLIREFDERAGWLKWGCENCTQWLHWRCDLSPQAAREKLRVAHALKDLPAIAAAFSTGKLSYSKVRALTRVATVDNEASLVAFALTTSAARVEERCRQLRYGRPRSVGEALRAHERRCLKLWRDHDRGMMTITVELPLEQGELVAGALDHGVASLGMEGPEFEKTSWQAQQADALVAMAERFLEGGHGASAEASGKGSKSPAWQVMLHVDASALSGGEGRSDFPVESVRRLCCDSGVVSIVDEKDGEPLSVGRRRRTIPTALRRALQARDGGCRFPGCTHRSYVDAHHVKHWAYGGETSLDNTMLLCSAHHRLVHEGGYQIRKDGDGRWYFRRPDGRAIPALGYRPEDTADDDVDDGADAAYSGAFGASAEACGLARERREPDGVREAAETYGSCRPARKPTVALRFRNSRRPEPMFRPLRCQQGTNRGCG